MKRSSSQKISPHTLQLLHFQSNMLRFVLLYCNKRNNHLFRKFETDVAFVANLQQKPQDVAFKTQHVAFKTQQVQVSSKEIFFATSTMLLSLIDQKILMHKPMSFLAKKGMKLT